MIIFKNIGEILEQDRYLKQVKKSTLKYKLIFQIVIALSFSILSITNMITKSYSMLVFTTIGAVANIIFALASKKLKSEELSAYTSIITCSLLFVIFVVNGGNDGFACLWVVLFPLVSMIVMDFRIGLYTSCFFQIFLIIVFWTPINEKLLYEYNNQFCLRFPLLFFVSFTLSYFLTISLQQAEYKEYRHAAELEKERENQKILLNTVPAGIGIFEVNEQGVTQNYLNDTFYNLIHTTREERQQYIGINVLDTSHPEDVVKLRQSMKQLLEGEDFVQLDYRIKDGNSTWTWLQVTALVVQRKSDSVIVHTAFYECTESKLSQLQLLQNQRAVALAEQQGKLSIWTYNIDKNIMAMQTPVDSMGHMGYPASIFNIKKSFIESGKIHPDDANKVFEVCKKLEDGQEMVESICRLMNQNTGKYDWIHMYYQRIENNSDGDRMAVGVSFDVNEQHEAIERYQTEQKLREQLYANAAFYIEYSLTNNLYVGGDNLAERYQEQSWKFATFEEYREHMIKVVDEFYLEDVVEKMYAGNLLKAFQEGTTKVSCEFRSKESSKTPSKWYRILVTMVKRPDTGEVMAFVYVEDMEEEKNAQLAIESSMSDGIESIAIINLADGQTRVISENGIRVAKEEEKQFVYNDDFVNRSSKATITEEREFSYNAALLQTIRKELKNQESYQYSVSTNFVDGIQKRKLFRFRYLDDRKTNVVLSISDITSIYLEDLDKKKQLEAALIEAQEANYAKAEFYSRMSHDMRTPMNGILGLTALSEDENDASVLKDNMEKIDDCGKYLLGIINDTLDIQRIESGKLILNPEIVNGRRVIETAIEMVQPSIAAKNIDFQIVNKGVIMDCDVCIDPVRMKQIFVNLISNAIKFTPEGGIIVFEFECLGRENGIVHDRFTVRDNGVGMSKSFLRDKIFRSYEQEHNAFSNQYSGTGLGLSIVKKLIDLMGGTIKVESKLGEGSAFIICLDIERVEGEHENNVILEKAEKKRSEKELLDGCKILLAEDHPLNAEIAKKLLEKVGATVTWVKDGQECLDTMKQFTPGQFDVILMDLRMPIMDGLTAAKEIRKLEDKKARSIPIIAMTANAYSDDVEHCIASGMNAHIAKPIEPKIFYDTLAMYFHKKN